MNSNTPTPRTAAAWTLACVALGLFFSTQLYIIMAENSRPITWAMAIRWELFTWCLWGVLALPVVALARVFPIEGRRAAASIVVHIAGAAILSVAHLAIAASWFTLVEAEETTAAVWKATFRFQFVIDFHWNVFIYGAILAGVHAVRFHRGVREGESRAARLEAHLARARLDALHMQLRPHFLFNTLNSIAALVPEDPRGAERMIVDLSDLLRTALDRRESPTVPLRDELTFARRYLDIEQVRFGDRLTVRFSTDPGLDDRPVPALILQPLVENAIRHAVAPRTGPSTIEVSTALRAGAIELEVRDDGPGPGTPAAQGTGIGLENTRARLHHLHGDAASLDLLPGPSGRGCVARIRIPAGPGAPEPAA